MTRTQLVEFSPGSVSVIEGHLGGYYTTVDPPSQCPKMWKHIIDKFNIKSVIEIGRAHV